MVSAAALAAGGWSHPGRPHSPVRRDCLWNKARGSLKLPSGPADTLARGGSRTNWHQNLRTTQKYRPWPSLRGSQGNTVKGNTSLTFHGLLYIFIIAVHAAGGCWKTTPRLLNCFSRHPWGVMGMARCDNWRPFLIWGSDLLFSKKSQR